MSKVFFNCIFRQTARHLCTLQVTAIGSRLIQLKKNERDKGEVPVEKMGEEDEGGYYGKGKKIYMQRGGQFSSSDLNNDN